MNLFESTTQSVHWLMLKLQRRIDRKSRQRPGPRRKGRRLRTEALESRQLLAADFQPFQDNSMAFQEIDDRGLVAPPAFISFDSPDGRANSTDLNFTGVSNDASRSSSNDFRGRDRFDRNRQPTRPQPPADTSQPDVDEVRSIDGSGNNLQNPELGSSGQELLRMAEADYADGISAPAGEDRPSTREISNVLSAADLEGTRNDRDLSAFIYVWGQFIDHDIDLTQDQVDGGETLDIVVPTGDPQFDPAATGQSVISFTRSQYAEGTGTSVDNPRQQISDITAFVDGSQVYGSDQQTADSLREFSGGRLLITDDGLLPTDEDGNVMAGDIRANENVALTALQALFVREHNRIADEIAAADSTLGDEEIYQQARALVIAEIQSITYNEFLPALLGTRALSRYEGYDATVDPTIANEFSTAAYRFGHSTLNDDVEFFDNDGRAVREDLSLAEAFRNPSLLEETGIDSILKYDASTLAQEIDLEVVDSLRNALFGPPGSGGLDLVAMNIQRGRDHGLADYNTTREAYGFDPVDSFAEITSDVELQEKLESLYGDVNNIDLWVGLLAEDHVSGASVGELTQAIIVDQFERLRDGDRFWYENVFQGRQLQELQSTTLADVIERNTTVQGLQDNVFLMKAEVSGTVTQAAADVTNPVRRGRGGGQERLRGVEGVTVELLNDAGEVIAQTTTDGRGMYHFDSFDETGDYQIRVAESDDFVPVSSSPLDILVSNGQTRLRGLDFQVAIG